MEKDLVPSQQPIEAPAAKGFEAQMDSTAIMDG